MKNDDVEILRNLKGVSRSQSFMFAWVVAEF